MTSIDVCTRLSDTTLTTMLVVTFLVSWIFFSLVTRKTETESDAERRKQAEDYFRRHRKSNEEFFFGEPLEE